ncbi:hypothetical protein [Aeromicrobium sp. HA]|uniref:hypothetical protein n=1 Tax=Aeromicrobium sp. HA TaxID=3009077 RepID=UPI0022AFFF73|nr:hypothetical protein [Aeromicrobium sp. HA]
MSASLTCDNCGTSLILDHNGTEAESGEDAAWIELRTRTYKTRWDACTLTCAIGLLDHGPIREVVESELQSIVDIARAVRGEGELDNGGADS